MARGLTLREFISKYASESENNTATYIRSVADTVGIDPDKPMWGYLRLPKLR